jgi:Xaa-Pro dipeptidase
MYAARLDTLRAITREAGLDAVALVPGCHLRYVTGQDFHLMERPVVGVFPTEGDPVFILPHLELDKFADPPFPMQIISYTDAEGYTGAFQKALAALPLEGKRLGVEGFRMRFAESQILAHYQPRMHVFDATQALSDLRIRKSADEIAALREAIAISEDALHAVIAGVKPGMTERAIANDLLIAMLKRGGGPLPFDPIVLTGPNSALPHGAPGDRTLQPGDLLLIDYGTTVRGYASDITRMFVLGELTDPQLIAAYAAVKAANEAGRKVAGPGVPCQDVDRAARGAITEAGFGDYFRHRTGHGLGMEAHEAPFMREGNKQKLEPGHVFTVEPGVYLRGVGGIRIEDDVLVTADGAESLTTFPRELQVIPV